MISLKPIKTLNTTIQPFALVLASLGATSLISYGAHANQTLAEQQQRFAEERSAQLQERLIPNPTVSIALDDTATAPVAEDVNEDNCFVINQISFAPLIGMTETHEALSSFNFALMPELYGETRSIGQCLGVLSINRIATNVQNRLIEQGFATTRVAVGNQNLASGSLILTLIPGRVGKITADTSASPVPVYVSPQPNRSDNPLPAVFGTALPIKSGDVLNIRQLETALENLKRVQGTEANFSISPSADMSVPGYSDINIAYAQSRRVNTSISLDDSGSLATGKYQAGLTLSFNNPTNNNDLLYVTYGYGLGNHLTKGDTLPLATKNLNIGYVVPYHNWLFNGNYSKYSYDQTVAGANQDYEYSGDSSNTSLTASYLLNRDASSKTYWDVGGFVKTQSNYIDDTEIEVQRRKSAGWSVAIRHEKMYGASTLNSSLGYQHGTGAFNALTPPEALFGEGSNRAGIISASTSLTHPMALGQNPQGMIYKGVLRGQYADRALVPNDRLAIGGRYTVRGFDGERVLSGDHGLLLRQDVSFALPNPSHRFYLGLDAGYIKMDDAAQDDLLLGNSLIGGALGFKGSFDNRLNYDIFAGRAIKQPDNFSDKDWVTGFSVNMNF